MPGVRAKFKLFDKGERRLDRLREVMAKANGYIKAGVLEEDEARLVKEITGLASEQLTNAEIAFVHEFGAGNNPERSFVRAAFDANRDAYLSMLERMVPLIMDEKLTARRALELVGQRLAADIKRRIQSGISPALSESTIAAKGSSVPLIDTGQLVGSVTYAYVPRRAPRRAE